MIYALGIAIGIIAGLTTIIRNVLQIINAKKERESLETDSAVKIQRAFRRHRTARFSYGGLKLEFSTEDEPTFHQVEEPPPAPAPAPPPEEKKKPFKLFGWK